MRSRRTFNRDNVQDEEFWPRTHYDRVAVFFWAAFFVMMLASVMLYAKQDGWW